MKLRVVAIAMLWSVAGRRGDSGASAWLTQPKGAHRPGAEHDDVKEHLKTVTATVRPLTVAEIQLRATIAARNAQRRKPYELFRTAADMEAALIHTEPPSYPRPEVEGWTATTLALGDAGVAERAYRETLEREPGSGRAYSDLRLRCGRSTGSATRRRSRAKAAKPGIRPTGTSATSQRYRLAARPPTLRFVRAKHSPLNTWILQ